MVSLHIKISDYNSAGEIGSYQLSQSNEAVDFDALLAGEDGNNPGLNPRLDLHYEKLSDTCCTAFDENLCTISVINTIDKIGQKAEGSKSDYIEKEDFEKIKTEYETRRQQAQDKWLAAHPGKDAADFEQALKTRKQNYTAITLASSLDEQQKDLLKDYVFNNDIDLGDRLKEEDSRNEILTEAQEWQTENFETLYNQALEKHSLHDLTEEENDDLMASAEIYYHRYHTLEGWKPQFSEDPTAEQEATTSNENNTGDSSYKTELDEIFMRHCSDLGVFARTVEDAENPDHLVKEFYNPDTNKKTGICAYLGSSQKFAIGSEDFRHYQAVARTAKEQGYNSLNCENFAEATSTMKIMLVAAYAEEGLNVRNFDTSLDYLNNPITQEMAEDAKVRLKKIVTKEMRKDMFAAQDQLAQAQKRCSTDPEYQALTIKFDAAQEAINKHPLQVEYNAARRSGDKEEIRRLQKELEHNAEYLELKSALEEVQDERSNTDAGIALDIAQKKHQNIFNHALDIYIKSNAGSDDTIVKNRLQRLEKIAKRRIDKPMVLTQREGESDADFQKRQDAVKNGRYEDLLKQRPGESDTDFQQRKDKIRQRHEEWKKDKDKKNRRYEKQNLLKASIKRYNTSSR